MQSSVEKHVAEFPVPYSRGASISEASPIAPSNATHSGADTSPRKRSAGLDLARAIAVTAVLLAHDISASLSPVASTLLIWIGEAGVELFFSLSGFLIGGILIDMALSGVTLRAVVEFLFRRGMRTLPLYYIALIVGGLSTRVWNVHAYLLLQNFYPNELRAVIVSWSLVMEEYFYLFFPIIMFIFYCFSGRKIQTVALTALFLVVACTTMRWVNIDHFMHHLRSVPATVVHEHPFMRMDCAAYGVLAACLLRHRPQISRWLSAPRAAWLLSATILLLAGWGAVFLAVSFLSISTQVAWGAAWWSSPYYALQHSILNLLFAVVVALLFLMRIRMSGWTGWCVRQLSLISYSLYLFHVPVRAVVEEQLGGESKAGRLVVTIATTLVVSAVSYYGIERPLLSVRDRVVPRRYGLLEKHVNRLSRTK